MSKARKEEIRELETELKIVYVQLYIIDQSDSGFHSRHNKLLAKYWAIIDRLEKISVKWKIKKIIRRLKHNG